MLGRRQVGKLADFDSAIRWFESSRPIQFQTRHKRVFDFGENNNNNSDLLLRRFLKSWSEPTGSYCGIFSLAIKP